MRKLMCHKGVLEMVEEGIPHPEDPFVVVKTDFSAISTGTESMVIRAKATVALGNSGTGIVHEVGAGVTHVRKGERVAVYGVPAHAEYFVAPKHLVAPVPAHVDAREAAFTGLGAIAIQALRQADVRFGENVVIIGLGILGQIIAQIADAAACHVFAMDVIEERCNLLRQAVPSAIVCSSSEELSEKVKTHTDNFGVDCVLICASSKEHPLLDQGIELLRDRGKVVIVGVPEGNFSRNALYAKEAQIIITRAGGPGRSDTRYEGEGIDYPIGYVRWTEGRNIAEFVRMLADQRLNIQALISHTYDFSDIIAAYQQCMDSPRECMGMLIQYDGG